MKKKLLVLSLIASFCLFVPVIFSSKINAATTVSDARVFEKESNDNINSATAISVNTLVGGNMETKTDKDWYTFTLTQPGYVSISFYNEYVDSSSSYWEMDLVTADDKSFFGDKFVGNATVKQDTVITGLDSGTYYLLFTPYYHTDKNYAFTVNYTEAGDWETEFNDTLATADAIKTNAKVNGTLRVDNDKDWYSLELPADGVVWFTFGNEYIDSSSSYWDTTIYDDQNNKIYNFRWQGNNEVDKSERKVGLPAGKYYVLVEKYYYSAKPYHFILNYTKTSNWEKEFNNSIATANKINSGKFVNGLLMDSDDKDWYSVNVSKSGKARIAFAHEFIDSSSKYWEVAIYDSNNKLVSQTFAGSDLGTKYSDEIAVTSGTYYILVDKYYFSSKEYHVALEFTGSDSFAGLIYDASDNSGDNGSENTDDGSDNNNVSQSKGTKFTVGDLTYKVTDDEEVTVTGATSDAKNIVIPATITVSGTEYEVVAIAKKAFKGNSKLTSVVINADLEQIYANAFYGCKKITSLTINGDVDTIGSKAFYNCKNLKLIEINTDTIDKIGSKAFYKIYKKATFKVDEEAYSDFSKLLKKSKIPSKAKIQKV